MFASFFAKLAWNAISIAAIIILGWIGINAVRDSLFNPPPPKVTVQVGKELLEEIKRVNKQIFIEHYNAVEITYSEAPSGWLTFAEAIGIKQEFIVLVRGNVPAGFDLSKLGEQDIWVSQDRSRAQITLPPPQIFEENVSVDISNSTILAKTDFCPNLLCADDLSAYKDVIEPEARRRLIETAMNNEILSQVAADGQAYYQGLLSQLGIAEVRVIVKGYTP